MITVVGIMTEKILDEKITSLVSELSKEDIKRVVERFQSELEQREHSDKKAAIAQIMAIADSAGLIVTFSDVDLSKRKTGVKIGTRAKIKYRNPATGQEWSGRGLKPKWVLKLVAEGKNIDDYLTSEFTLPDANV